MNKNRLEIDKNKISFETRKNINLALNRDGCALVDTKWLVEENFERKEPTIENVMNSEFIYIIDKILSNDSDKTIVRRINVGKEVTHKTEHWFYINACRLFNINYFIEDYKNTWAFSPCDLEGSIWIN